MNMEDIRLVVVSNRLPIRLNRIDEKWHVSPGGGGLVAALNPILKKHGGSWVGWLGTTEEGDFSPILKQAENETGYHLNPVFLTEEEIQNYYFGFSNEILWPLFHSLETRCNFKPEYWKAYSDVNQKFAQKIAENCTEKDYIWVQDYQLMEVALHLKKLKPNCRTGFFLHIPFPPPDIFLKLPWRTEILKGLMEYDTIGVHTANDQRNLIEAFRRTRPLSAKISGTNGVKIVSLQNRTVKVGVFPISIDYKAFSTLAASPLVEERTATFHNEFPNQQIVLGTDRLDYTKGIPERILAFSNALERYPEMREKITLVQVLVPSRIQVPQYIELKTEVERLIGETNGKFGVPGWTPIQYYYRNLPHDQLAAYYRAADIALITSLRDGMNLVAKEYVAANLEEQGVLILSEFTGAAAEFGKGAILINPYDIDGTADAIYQAYKMSNEEKRRRMHLLRQIVAKNDIHHWLEAFLKTALNDGPTSPTHAEEYVPTIDVSSTSN